MKRIISFGVLFFSMYALHAQSSSFNLTDTSVSINSVYTYCYNTYICSSADLYNPCSNKFNSKRIDSIKYFLRKNPTVSIEIGWHTDQRGSSEYNTLLSQKYATLLKQYIVDSTITEDRVLAIGYGENKPVYDDKAIELMLKTEDKERAYEINRRVVIRIIKL